MTAYPRVAVVVTSFNRPRMLRECLLSVAAARPDEVFICDDGSDCLTETGRPMSIHRIVGFAFYYRVKYLVLSNPPIPPAIRMVAPRQGALINRALDLVECEITTLICDDDIMHPGWLDAVRMHFWEQPQRELVRGDWLQFEDGQTPSERDEECPLDARQMTAGNFAWHSSLHRERGVRWSEEDLNCLDNSFLDACRKKHIGVFGVPNLGIAGWRREHPKANGNYANGRAGHRPEFMDILAAGALE